MKIVTDMNIGPVKGPLVEDLTASFNFMEASKILNAAATEHARALNNLNLFKKAQSAFADAQMYRESAKELAPSRDSVKALIQDLIDIL